jgi:hypothetical protein
MWVVEQSLEFQSPVYVLFVDCQRALDCLNRAWIWDKLRVRGFPSKFMNVIRKGYEISVIWVDVAGEGRANADVNVRIQKAMGLFSKLRKVWISTSTCKDTKIRIVNACAKPVLLYGCETWLVTGKLDLKGKLLLSDV